MRIRSKSRKHFHATHKGHEIIIDREADGRFYIVVTAESGVRAYNGWAPDSICRMKDAKIEAIRGACL